MNITFISPYSDLSAIGIRTLSAHLKRHGFNCRIFYLPLQSTFYSLGDFKNYSEQVINSLVDYLHNDNVIAISLMTNYFECVRDLTLRLKKKMPDKIFVWGGIHPTVFPEQCVDTADYICVGEGEKPLLTLCERLRDGGGTNDIAGLWQRVGKTVIKNKPGEVFQDLDQISPLDYATEGHFVLTEQDSIIPLTGKNLPQYLGYAYWTMYTRGCPFRCTYCCNNALRMINSNLTTLRCKSAEGIVNEIKEVKRQHPFLKYVYFADDTFFALSEEQIEKFAFLYKKEVGMPFIVTGLHPNVFSEKKVQCLIDSGLLRTRMGIQSGSKKMLDLYKRKQTEEKIIGISSFFKKNKGRLVMPSYDIILDNPWEDKEDKLQTIKLLGKLSAPFSLNLFSLVFFPGTDLYHKAVDEGIVSGDQHYKHYHSIQPTYLNLVTALFGLFKVPSWLLSILLNERVVYTYRKFPRLHKVVFHLTMIRKGLACLVHREYSVFPPKLRAFFVRIFPPHRIH